MWNGNGWKKGDNYAICQSCGLEFLASKLKKRWDGLIVCPDDFEHRHPQEFARARPEYPQAKGFVVPSGTDTFISRTCDTRSALPGVAIPGCAIPGYQEPTVPSGTF